MKVLKPLTSLVLFAGTLFANQDPFADNNYLYPSENEWPFSFRTSNYDYPLNVTGPTWTPGGPNKSKLTLNNAEAYVDAVKEFISDDVSGAVNNPLNWTPNQVGWYNVPWGAQGTTQADGSIDPESGRDSILGSYTGQILPPDTFSDPKPTRSFQNHAVIYYNDVAATMLGKVFKDPFIPDASAAQFPEGSIVVKIEAAALSPTEWPAIAGSSQSYVYRPLTQDLLNPDIKNPKPVVTEMYFTQIVVKVKDSVAAPDTGWVFMVYAYDTDSKGLTTWDRAVPVGAMWGNDPEYANTPSGKGPSGTPLQETWISSQAPAYTLQALGWGGRLSGPMDVGQRHNVVTVSGKRYPATQSFPASSCLSCHGSAQVPFVANLYPSPNLIFPLDGTPFLLYDPGSQDWAEWFQNRAGDDPMSGKNRSGIIAIDYDMLLTFTLQQLLSSNGSESFMMQKMMGH